MLRGRILGICAVGIFLNVLPGRGQAIWNVSDTASMQTALSSAISGDTINFTGNITLSGALPAVAATLTINGNGFTLDGTGTYQGLQITAGTVLLQNLTIQNAVVQGQGGSSANIAGGGGAAGLGGGLFVGSAANVSLVNMNFSSNQALGGAGGIGRPVAGADTGSDGGGPSPGLGGAFGGNATSAGGNGGNGGSGGSGGIGSGGGGGGGGGAGANGAPGGNGGIGGSGGNGGAGGYGGGGGGAGISGTGGVKGAGGNFNGGPGGFGFGGPGGFGGGAGGLGGIGGVGDTAGGGGGGLGAGGAVFVQSGGLLTMSGNLGINSNTATGGGGGGASGPNAQPGATGSAAGAGMFFSGSGTLVVAPTTGLTQTISNSITDEVGSGLAGGTGVWGLAMGGAGTLVLNGTQQFTGATTVAAGTLRINGSSMSATTVLGGGTLGGSGTLNALATIGPGGILAPGNSPGTITFASGLTITDGAAFSFELGSTSDLILVTGGTLTGPASAAGATFNFAAASGFGAGTYTLIDGTGATLSGFDLTDFTLGTGISGYNFSFGLTGNVLSVTATAIPEPATATMFFGACVLSLAGLTRRRASR